MRPRRYLQQSEEAATATPPETMQHAQVPRQRHSGPRSRLVEAIAVLLLAKPMRSAEIAELLGHTTRYISSYLSYWKTRGLFDYENGFWFLTEQGEDFAKSIAEREMSTRVSQYAALAQRLLSKEQVAASRQVRETVNSKRGYARRRASGEKLSFTASQIGESSNERQRSVAKTCVNALLADLDELTADEQTVLEALLDHYVKWGSTYTYLDHLEKQLEADRVWLLGALRLLQSKKLVYIYTDRRLGVRVGLSKKIRELLEGCAAD